MGLIVLFDLKNIKYAIKSFSSKNYVEINDEHIQFGYDREFAIYWDEVIEIRINRENRKMCIEYEREGKEAKLEFELWRLESYNLIEFTKNLKVFMDRYKLKLIN